MNRTFFTSDTHFMQERIRGFSGRPFKNVEEMTRVMIRNWNKVVEENDIVYHLGDFGLYSIAKELKGEIILLVGNCERADLQAKTIDKNMLLEVYGFHDVITDDRVTANIYGHRFDLVHEPSHRNPDVFTLFGHIHKLQMVKQNALNVGVDCHNFKPVTFEEVMQWKYGIQKFHDNEVFMQ